MPEQNNLMPEWLITVHTLPAPVCKLLHTEQDETGYTKIISTVHLSLRHGNIEREISLTQTVFLYKRRIYYAENYDY